MAEAVDIDVIDFEDEYDKVDPIDVIILTNRLIHLMNGYENKES